MFSPLGDDIFFITNEKDYEKDYIIYSPLRGTAFSANRNAVEKIKKYLSGNEFTYTEETKKILDHLKVLESMEVKVPDENWIFRANADAYIILTQKCNLNCSYCYAIESKSDNTISKDSLQIAIDYIFSKPNPKASTNKLFSFIGGGEPTMAWDLFTWAVNYIKESAKKKSYRSGISLTTNGTLLNEEKILFIKNNNIGISISFDVLPEIQNCQRSFPMGKGSFEIIDKNIRELLKNDIFPGIRSTITDNNVNLIEEMVLFAIKNYRGIKHLHFEPVTKDDIENTELFYSTYIESFFKARIIGVENNIKVYNSITNSINKIKNRFCPGEFCITPSGEISSCHRVSSKENIYFGSFFYGKINNCVDIDNDAQEKILKSNRPNECFNCFAKWHCAGSCLQNRLMHSERQQGLFCNFYRGIIKRHIEEKLLI